MNHDNVPSDTAAMIGPLLSGWHCRKLDDEQHPHVRWCVKTMFDHDWEHHLLIMQWRSNGETFEKAGYSLWFITDDLAIFVKEWPRADAAPLIDAAAQVMSWQRLAREMHAQPER